MKKYLGEFFSLCQYPAEACTELLNAWDKISSAEASREIFEKHIAAYEGAPCGKIDFKGMLEDIRRAAEISGVNTYTAELLIFCCFTRHLRRLYAEHSINDGIWLDSVLDLRYKLYECHAMYGVWGSFVAYWFDKFFTLERFALGRLQYEDHLYFCTEEPYTKHSLRLEKNVTPALELHIPSSGKLTEESVTDSLKKAYSFFKDSRYMQNGVLVCECSSWLLYPALCDFLPEGSNVVKFQKCFENTATWQDPYYQDCWRLFNKKYSGTPEDLPRDTSMRRAFAQWLDEGNTPGCGISLLLFDGEKILTMESK